MPPFLSSILGYNSPSGRITSADPTNQDFQDAGDEMVRALSDCGFLYLKNHKVDQNILDYLNSAATSFFNLDEKVKTKYHKAANGIGGYFGRGGENLDEENQGKSANENMAPLDAYRETLDYNKCEPNAAFTNVAEVPSLNAAFSQFYEEMKKLTIKILKALERGLGLLEDSLFDLHKNLMVDGTNNSTSCRILFYPGIDGDTEVPEGSLRCGSHTDYGSFTFVFQDDIGGLEILNNQNVWQSAKPMEGVVAFNLGDMLETFTAGKLTATRHRVVIPKNKERRKLDRRSYAYFVFADHDVTVHPYFPCPEGKYPPINPLQYINRRIGESTQHAY